MFWIEGARGAGGNGRGKFLSIKRVFSSGGTFRCAMGASIVLPCLAEGDIGPLLHDEAEAPLAGGKVGEVAVGVEGRFAWHFFSNSARRFLSSLSIN